MTHGPIRQADEQNRTHPLNAVWIGGRHASPETAEHDVNRWYPAQHALVTALVLLVRDYGTGVRECDTETFGPFPTLRAAQGFADRVWPVLDASVPAGCRWQGLRVDVLGDPEEWEAIL